MVYTIGPIWFWIYLGLAVVAVMLAFWHLLDAQRVSVGVFFFAVATALFIYLSIYAGTHFRVGVNERALIINTIRGEVVGVHGPGVQSRPLLGVKVQNWPANKAYQIFLDLEPGTASATTKNNIALWVDTKIFLDLSDLDIEGAYRAVNGDWEVFYERYLETQLMNQVRLTSQDFLVVEHVTRRDDWTRLFDQNVQGFVAEGREGFGIKLVAGLTTMSWDFVSEDDAQAFDQAQRAAFLITQRRNEQAALNIEREMATTRAQILVETSLGATDSWEQVVDFISGQPPQIQQFLVEFMQLQGTLEYLRLVGQLQPENIFPPGAGPQLIYSTNPLVLPTPLPPGTDTAEP